MPSDHLRVAAQVVRGRKIKVPAFVVPGSSAVKKQAEAERTVMLRHAGEGAVLGTIADMIEHGFNRVLTIMADWAGISGSISDSVAGGDQLNLVLNPGTTGTTTLNSTIALSGGTLTVK